MADSKGSGGAAGDKPGADASPATNPAPPAAAVAVAAAAADAGGDDDVAAAAEARRPFTALSQVDADLALARVLQEQVYVGEISRSGVVARVPGPLD